MELILENLRCFAGKHRIPIKPLTLLTGENSSGKSTFLAALASVYDRFGFPLRPRFNEPPYSLGNFDTIATYKGGRYGRATSFSLGHAESGRKSRGRGELVATYTGRQGLVEISKIIGRNDSMEATMSFVEKDNNSHVQFEVTRGKDIQKFEVALDDIGGKSSRFEMEDIFFYPFLRFNDKTRKASNEKPDEKMLRDLSLLFRRVQVDGKSRALSVAPIRTKPRRTYDQISEEFTPEGEHVPFVLSGILSDPLARARLERFGKESGLFRQISVKKLGDKISDPIQVMVTNSSRPANLLDVGYGVSQALPVVVESLLAAPQNLLLLQQPEVHLHPRAQAALGSLLVDFLTQDGKQFVVETHSDYIIDRIRQEIARGKIDCGDVCILYFEKRGNATEVFFLSLDSAGNVLDAPPTYRDFFLHEELNLFNRSEL